MAPPAGSSRVPPMPARRAGRQPRPGAIGDLYVAGPTSALGYWNQRERSRGTFLGSGRAPATSTPATSPATSPTPAAPMTCSKSPARYVSPVEVEAALGAHPAVLEAAVVGQPDENQLIKPKAFVVLQAGQHGDETLVHALQAHVRARLAPHKYPRWIEFVPELPKTATGRFSASSCAGREVFTNWAANVLDANLLARLGPRGRGSFFAGASKK